MSAPMLTNYLAEKLVDPAGLALAAAQARRFAVEDAAERLAALVLSLMPAVAGGKREHAA